MTEEILISEPVEPLDALATIEPQPLTTARNLTDEWERHLDMLANTEEMSTDTVRVYKSGLRRFRKWWDEKGGALDVIKEQAVRQWIADMRADGKSGSTRSGALAALRSFCQWLKIQGVIESDPTAGIKAGKKVSHGHRRQALNQQQARELLDLTSLNKRDRALLWIMLFTAARSIEMHRLEIKDIRQRGNDLVLMVQGKGKREGDKEPLYLALPDAQQAVRDYLEELARRRYTSGPLFVTYRYHNGKPRQLSRRTLSSIGKEALRKIGIDRPDTTMHSLRHTAITTAIENNATPLQVQAMARHKSFDTTMNYFHARDRKENAAERVIRYEKEQL